MDKFKNVWPEMGHASQGDSGNFARLIMGHVLCTLPPEWDEKLAYMFSFKSQEGLLEILRYARATYDLCPSPAQVMCGENGEPASARANARLMTALLESQRAGDQRLAPDQFSQWCAERILAGTEPASWTDGVKQSLLDVVEKAREYGNKIGKGVVKPLFPIVEYLSDPEVLHTVIVLFKAGLTMLGQGRSGRMDYYIGGTSPKVFDETAPAGVAEHQSLLPPKK